MFCRLDSHFLENNNSSLNEEAFWILKFEVIDLYNYRFQKILGELYDLISNDLTSPHAVDMLHVMKVLKITNYERFKMAMDIM